MQFCLFKIFLLWVTISKIVVDGDGAGEPHFRYEWIFFELD